MIIEKESDAAERGGRVIVEFEADMYRWEARADADWFFAALPSAVSDEVRELQSAPSRGFGAVRVQASIGSSTWRTSIFPGGDGRYVLPLKRSVRLAEGLEEGQPVAVRLEIAVA